MNKALLVLFALTAGASLIPDVADAQRGGRGGGFGGGGRIGGGGFGGGLGGGARMGGGSIGGPRMLMPPRGGMGGPRVGTSGGFRTGAITARPGGMPSRVAGISPGAGGLRQAAINNPQGRFDARLDNRFGNRGDGRYGVRPPGTWGGRYPYYRGRYPYYGRYYGRYPYYGNYYRGWGLATGAVIGAAAAYPYYNYPYYDYPYSTYQTPVASAGGYCVTPVRTCALINSAPIGTGCSCSTPGGRARGTVQ